MKQLSAAIKVGIVMVLVIAGGYGVWKIVGARPSGTSNFAVWAKFKDAAGLPLGSRVVIAGLPIGEISALGIEGQYARVTMRIRDDIKLWDNAIVYKKTSSLLGDFYLELDPGSAITDNAKGQTVNHELLGPGDEIRYVVEATSVDQLVKRIDETLPQVNDALIAFRDLAQDLQGVVNTDVKSIAKRIDRIVQTQAGTLESALNHANDALGRIDQITLDVQRQTRSGGNVDDMLANLRKASDDVRLLVADTRREVGETGAMAREKLDLVDELLARTTSVVGKVDEDQGTLGRLVNDSTIADNIEDITTDAKGFLGTLFGMQTYVSLRTEYGLTSGSSRNYVGVELRTRPDKFYLIEAMQDSRGTAADVFLESDPAGGFNQRVVIENKARFTFQFAKRIQWLTLRYGIKESTGGVGADLQWFDSRLKVSIDAFDATFDALPRIKVAAAYELFGFLYVLAGLDDVLNDEDSLVINGTVGTTASGNPVPGTLREVKIGRDAFVGAMIQFNDHDLAALLTVGGAVLAGIAD